MSMNIHHGLFQIHVWEGEAGTPMKGKRCDENQPRLAEVGLEELADWKYWLGSVQGAGHRV